MSGSEMVSQGGYTQFAPAKINLYLHVTGKRDDGYHLLDSLMAFVDFGDIIEVSPAGSLSLVISGPFAAGLEAGPDNLVLKAASGLQKLAGVTYGASITLQKNLPVASGIGGGSADAAATLKALCKLWQISPNSNKLLELALELGADVPVCLSSTAVFVSGIGETLIPAETLPQVPMVLVNPGVAVSTPTVFKARLGAFSSANPFTNNKASFELLAELLAERNNDLMAPAISLAPEIGDALSLISSCQSNLLSRMSGTGATCFGLFSDQASAGAAAEKLQKLIPLWWVQETKLISQY